MSELDEEYVLPDWARVRAHLYGSDLILILDIGAISVKKADIVCLCSS